MKIRRGFVTNSSSSSFVIALKQIPKTAEELKKVLYGDQTVFKHPYYDDVTYTTKEVAKTIFNDITSVLSNSEEQIKADVIEVLAYDIDVEYVDGITDYFDLTSEQRKRIDWDDYYERQRKAATQLYDKIKGEHPDSFICTLSYADEDGSYGCALEHGNTFPNDVLIRRISQH